MGALRERPIEPLLVRYSGTNFAGEKNTSESYEGIAQTYRANGLTKLAVVVGVVVVVVVMVVVVVANDAI